MHSAQCNRRNETNAEPERDAAQFLIVIPQHLHCDGVRTLQQNKMSAYDQNRRANNFSYQLSVDPERIQQWKSTYFRL